MSEQVRPLCIAAGHPSLPGHFPGAPVVPGVLLLDRLAAALEDSGAGRFARLDAVKFLTPLLPDQQAELRWRLDGRQLRFRLLRDGRELMRGSGELA